MIAPSLPGYGLSFRPGQKRFSIDAITDCVADLMTDVLGYRRFAAQAVIGVPLSLRVRAVDANKIIGIYISLLAVRRDPARLQSSSEEERRYAAELGEFLKEETRYQSIQGTRPQTLAFGLSDSPAGLAAWIVQKFHAWTDNEGTPDTAVDRDRMLANIAIFVHGLRAQSTFRWAIASSRKKIIRPPRSVAERVYTDIRRWTVMHRGGHFAAME